MSLYFLDAEFIEDGRTIDLISLGIVAEDGREFYVVNQDCNIALASPWVWANVLQPMGVYSVGDWSANPGDPSIPPKLRDTISSMKPKYAIAAEVVAFCDDKPVFWGEWSSYDWVTLCQCFGTMIDLPEHFPMRCNDVVQYAEHVGLTSDHFPESLEVDGNHNALLGAKTVKLRYDWLSNGKPSSN